MITKSGLLFSAKCLRDNKIELALDKMRIIAASLHECRDIALKIDEIKDDYGRIQNSFVHGHQDDMRETLLDQLFERTWSVYDQLDCYRRIQVFGCEIQKEDFELLLTQLLANPDDDLAFNKVFEYIATVSTFTSAQRQTLHQVLLDDQLPTYIRATLLGAITLFLRNSFDPRIIEDLYIFTLDDQPLQIQMRAWVTLVLVAFWHVDRIEHNSRIKEQYKLLCESSPEILLHIQRSLLLCYMTQKADPLVQQIAESLEGRSTNKKQIASRFYTFITRGIDMSYYAFRKSCEIPFFCQANTRHHWLMPFSIDHPYVKSIVKDKPNALSYIQTICGTANQCDTDCYLAAISTLEMSDLHLEQMDKILGNLKSSPNTAATDPQTIARKYIQDLYRYFTVYPLCDVEKEDCIIEGSMLMSRNPWLKSAVDDADSLRAIAQLCYEDRLCDSHFAISDLLEVEETSEWLLKLIEFPHPFFKDFNVINSLNRCIEHFPDCAEAYWKLADIYDQKQLFYDEKRLLDLAQANFANDNNFSWRMGRCLIEMQHPEQALEPLYKSDLTNEGNKDTQYQLVRAYFLLGKIDKAVLYSDLLIEQKKLTKQEQGMCAIVALANGNFQTAYDRLKGTGYLNEDTDFRQVVKQLKPYGITLDDMILLRSQIEKYDKQR